MRDSRRAACSVGKPKEERAKKEIRNYVHPLIMKKRQDNKNEK